jgi:hypothetical protein
VAAEFLFAEDVLLEGAEFYPIVGLYLLTGG